MNLRRKMQRFNTKRYSSLIIQFFQLFSINEKASSHPQDRHFPSVFCRYFICLLLISGNGYTEEMEQNADAKIDDKMTTQNEPIEKATDNQGDDLIMLRNKPAIAGYQPLIIEEQEIAAAYLAENTGEQHGVVVFFLFPEKEHFSPRLG